MAIVPKVLGIETEYGITGGPGDDPIAASTLLVSAYAHDLSARVNWDFIDEAPGRDARATPTLTSVAPLIETHLANTVLTNGARFYVDHAHPEYSSPECRTPLSATLYDVAGEEVLRRSVALANQALQDATPIVVYKNNSDGKGNSYGTHENYLISRSLDFDHVVRAMTPHFISRQVFCGAGKWGNELADGHDSEPTLQLSQRADFFEEVVGLETTVNRPIVNTRDEPHSDAERYRRLHVIIGDANMSETATFLKLASTSILLGALETYGPSAFPPLPDDPVRALRAYSSDSTLSVAARRTDGSWATVLETQDELWRAARRFVDNCDTSAIAPEAEVLFAMDEWRRLLDDLAHDVALTANRVDWVAKGQLIDGYAARHDLERSDSRLRLIDLQYHDLRPERSLAARFGLRKLVAPEAVSKAVVSPPTDTRAYFRGRCVEKFVGEVATANWDSLVFALADGSFHRVPMMEPLRGTKVLTEQLLDNAPNAAALLSSLQDS